jgi:hypothetical protein
MDGLSLSAPTTVTVFVQSRAPRLAFHETQGIKGVDGDRGVAPMLQRDAKAHTDDKTRACVKRARPSGCDDAMYDRFRRNLAVRPRSS